MKKKNILIGNPEDVEAFISLKKARKANPDIYNWALEVRSQVDCKGIESPTVKNAVSAWLENDLLTAKFLLSNTGLNDAQIIYLATNEYFGQGRKERDFLFFLKEFIESEEF